MDNVINGNIYREGCVYAEHRTPFPEGLFTRAKYLEKCHANPCGKWSQPSIEGSYYFFFIEGQLLGVQLCVFLKGDNSMSLSI